MGRGCKRGRVRKGRSVNRRRLSKRIGDKDKVAGGGMCSGKSKLSCACTSNEVVCARRRLLRLQSDGDDPKQSSRSSAYVVVLHSPRRSQCFVPLFLTPPCLALCCCRHCPTAVTPSCLLLCAVLLALVSFDSAVAAAAVDVAPLGFAVANNE